MAVVAYSAIVLYEAFIVKDGILPNMTIGINNNLVMYYRSFTN